MPCRKPQMLVRLFALIAPFTLTACATTTDFAGSDLSFCSAARPIYWSTKDTTETIWQIKEHNAVGRVSCGWGTKHGK